MLRTAAITSLFMALLMVQGIPASAGYEASIAAFNTLYQGITAVKGADGRLYAAWSDNYDLKVAVSTDSGRTWSVENPATAHDGKLAYPVMIVDSKGNQFIFCRWHASYPATPDVWVLGQMNVYCVTNVSGSWTEELVIDHTTYNSGYGSSNNTALPFDAFVDGSDNVHLFLYHYYFYSYGGKTYEKVRSAGASGTWGALITAIHIYNPNVDQPTRAGERVVQTPGGGAVILARNPFNDDLYYVSREAGGVWSAPQILGKTCNYAAPGMDIDEEGLIHAVYAGQDFRTLYYMKDWAAAQPIFTLSGQNDRYPYIQIHAGTEGRALVAFRSYNFSSSTYNYYMARIIRQPDGSWSNLQLFKDLVTLEDEVVTAIRLETWDGKSLAGPPEWIYWDSNKPLPYSFHYWNEAAVKQLKADLNQDGKVDHLDLCILMAEWHETAE